MSSLIFIFQKIQCFFNGKKCDSSSFFKKIIKIHHSLSVAGALFGYITVFKRPYAVLHMEIYQILSRPCVSCHLGSGATMLPIWSECQASLLVVTTVEIVVYAEHSYNHLGNNLSEEF